MPPAVADSNSSEAGDTSTAAAGSEPLPPQPQKGEDGGDSPCRGADSGRGGGERIIRRAERIEGGDEGGEGGGTACRVRKGW